MAAEQPNRVLAMATGHGNELIQDLGLILLGSPLVAFAYSVRNSFLVRLPIVFCIVCLRILVTFH